MYQLSNILLKSRSNGKVLLDIPFLKLEEGKLTGLIGKSGSGKTLLLNTLSLINLRDEGLELRGELTYFVDEKTIQVDLSSIESGKIYQLFGKLGFPVTQSPASSFSTLHRLSVQVKDVLRSHFAKDSFKRQMEEFFDFADQMGIKKDQLDAYPGELSGGQIQRLSIALALTCGQKYLLCDEITASLDAVQSREVMNLIKELSSSMGIGALLVSHDKRLLEYYCDKIYFLADGVLSKEQKWISNDKFQPVQNSNPSIGGTVLKAVMINKFYSSAKQVVLKNFSCGFERGSGYGITGASGSGKTTLAKILAGLVESTSGHVEFKGKQLDHLSYNEVRKFQTRVQHIFQNPTEALNPSHTVAQMISYAFNDAKQLNVSIKQEELDEILILCQIHDDLRGLYLHQLSGGQQQRVQLALALIFKPDVLICDEPFSALDEEAKPAMFELLNQLKNAKQLTLIVVSHHLYELEAFCDFLLVMEEGILVEYDVVKKILKNPASDATKSLIQASIYYH